MRSPALAAALAALTLVASAALAQPPGPPRERPPGPPRGTLHAARLTAPITVDGALDEPVWREAEACDAFTQADPIEGVPPSQRTEVRVAYDEDAIYVGARMYDAHPDSIRALLTRRDVMVVADRIGVYFDPYLDRRSGYYFIVNAAGVQFDGTLMNDSWDDDSWDGVWSSAARIDDRGWTCEMRIPYSQMRFNREEHQRWGVNFKRVIARQNENDYVAWMPRGGSGYVSRFWDLEGLEGVNPRRSVEVVPYVTTKGEFLSHSAGDPFHDGSDYVPEGGADVRTALGTRLTLNATFNPDFGQVEVDPAVVNLSDVESYFQEKRPFFVEGMQNFRFGNEGASDYWSFNWPEPTFFYSRRIGRAPQVVGGATFVDAPIGTRILGAAKLTGKLTPTTNLGTLHAITGRETAQYADSPIDRWKSEAEPLTYYGATRTLKEFREGRKGLGFMLSTVARSFGDGGLDGALNRSSSVLGTDGWWFLDHDKQYVVSGYTALSHVTGSRDRIFELQSSSRHYLQRPDRVHQRIDPDATSLTGWASRYWLNKQSGHVLLNAAVGALDPRFEMNDIGFMSRAGLFNAHVGSGYQWTENNSWHRYANVLGSVFASGNFDGDMTAKAVWASSQVQWANRWYSRLNVDWFLEALDDRRTRGGPLMVAPAGGELTLEMSTDERRPVSYELELTGNRLTVGSSQINVNPTALWKPSSNLSVQIGPGFERVIEDAQWVAQAGEPTATATYGQRYVFAHLDQKTYYASARLNWTFTPRLSLQFYAQPLVSSGRYTDFKELAAARTYDFTRYAAYGRGGGEVNVTPATGAPFYFSEPDFDFKSLRGNAVLRWEYLPGSTVYVVWTHQRVDDELLPSFGVKRSFDRLLDAQADNIFLIKATRYFTL